MLSTSTSLRAGGRVLVVRVNFFHARLLVSTIGPLVVVGFSAMTYLIAVRRQGASSAAAAVEKIRRKHQTALLPVTFLVYSSAASLVCQTFACETLDDGVEYLRVDYRIHRTDGCQKTGPFKCTQET